MLFTFLPEEEVDDGDPGKGGEEEDGGSVEEMQDGVRLQDGDDDVLVAESHSE